MKIINIFIEEISKWFFSFLSFIPGRFGIYARYYGFYFFLKKCGKKNYFLPLVDIIGFKNISIGSGITAGRNLRLYASGNGSEEVILGDNVAINDNVMINADCGGRIKVGNNVLIGPNVVMRASNHQYQQKNVLIRKQGHDGKLIMVRDDVWIGANVVILAGVTIGQGAVIAAGSVVTKDVESYQVVAGIPARKIKERK